MKKLMYICHSVYIKDGSIFDPNYAITFGFLEKYFQGKYQVIRNSLYRNGDTRLYKSGINEKYSRIFTWNKFPDVFRYIMELFINTIVLLWYRPSVVYAIDPLSSFVPVILKRLRVIKKVFFLTPDFADSRFSSPMLNRVYFYIDRFCTKYANKNLCCSKLVIETKMKRYSLSEDKFFHFPNIPNPWTVNRLLNNKKIQGRVLYVGNISSHMDFILLFDSIGKLKNKFPSIKLVLAGEGDKRDDFEKYVKDNKIDNIEFLGQLSTKETLEEISKSELGVAIYNGEFVYDKYRDSCKIREYQALGAVPITTNIVKSNYDEIIAMNSGIIVKDVSEVPSAIEKFYSDKKNSDRLVANSYRNYEMYIGVYEDFYKLITS